MRDIYKDYASLYSNFDTFKRIVLGYTYKSVGNIPSKTQIRYTNAKLTDDEVRAIRARYAEKNITYKKLGEEYGVSEHTIACIVWRKTYAHVD